ncbi:MAG: type II toxin-antitoxin system RelE/ParE family toxin [Candidatus Azambacteria bacterium]|nr:type II toxin-antitoxin system RelE/ParE family toxin [Candidatus Azambacteria bacterium]
MPKWNVVFAKEAENDLDDLANVVRKRIIEKLSWLENNFDLTAPVPLGADWSGFFKLRIGDFRVIYKIDWSASEIFIVVVGHRSKIYKK